MIPDSIQQEAHALKLDGVESIYIIIPQKHDEIDMQAKEQRMYEMLPDLEFKHITSRRKVNQFCSGYSENFIDSDCFREIMTGSDAVLIADEWTDTIECRIEVMLALRAGKHMLNEKLIKAERFNTVNIKLQYDAK